MQGMQPRHRLLAVVLAVLALTAGLMVGCSKKSTPSGPLPDAATLLKQASESTKALKSAHLELAVTGKIEGLPIVSLSGNLANQPAVAATGTAQAKFGDSPIEVQFVVLDGHLWLKMLGDWDYYPDATAVYDVSVILNPETGLANLLTKATDTKAEARETVSGEDTVRVTGKVPADAVNNLKLKATDTMSATFWIQENGDHQLVRVKLDKTSDSAIQMTLSDWDTPVTATKPEGAPGP